MNLTILQQILSELKTDDKAQQIREICDNIQTEEVDNIEHIELLPTGPNIFLSLEVPGRTDNEIAFLTLERETSDRFLSVLIVLKKFLVEKGNINFKRQRVWEINDSRPEKILMSYAKTYKYLRGE